MWKVFLAFACHRLILLFVAFAAINASMAPVSSKRIQSTSALMEQFKNKIAMTREAQVLDTLAPLPYAKIISETKNPFYWIGSFLKKVTPLTSASLVLILSNLFCLLFLWELYALTSRMALPEVAVSTAIFALLWVTSYELSLGSYQSLTCLLVVLVVRHALDNTWLIGGLALGLLAVTDLIAVGLIPLLLILFWHYQRHEPSSEVLKKIAFFTIPLALALVLSYQSIPSFNTQYHASALATLVGFISRGEWGALFSQASLGQTISVIIFFAGMIVTVGVNNVWLHKLIPAYLFFVVLLFSDFGSLGSRIILSAVVLQGISTVSSVLVERLLQLGLIVISGFEIASIF